MATLWGGVLFHLFWGWLLGAGFNRRTQRLFVTVPFGVLGLYFVYGVGHAVVAGVWGGVMTYLIWRFLDWKAGASALTTAQKLGATLQGAAGIVWSLFIVVSSTSSLGDMNVFGFLGAFVFFGIKGLRLWGGWIADPPRPSSILSKEADLPMLDSPDAGAQPDNDWLPWGGMVAKVDVNGFQQCPGCRLICTPGAVYCDCGELLRGRTS